MPLKDEFSSDLSDIDLAEFADRTEEDKPALKTAPKKKKKKKINKTYRWKHLWVLIFIWR